MKQPKPGSAISVLPSNNTSNNTSLKAFSLNKRDEQAFSRTNAYPKGKLLHTQEEGSMFDQQNSSIKPVLSPSNCFQVPIAATKGVRPQTA